MTDFATRYAREAQITYRRTRVDLPPGPVFSSRDVARIARQLIGERMGESFLVFALDQKHRVIGYHEAGRGGTAECPVDITACLRYPLLAGAAAVILVHNHPSGSVEPSDSDVALTRRLCVAFQAVGLRVLDHVIVADVATYSFLDSGLMEQCKA